MPHTGTNASSIEINDFSRECSGPLGAEQQLPAHSSVRTRLPAPHSSAALATNDAILSLARDEGLDNRMLF